MIEAVSFLGGIVARLFTWGTDFLSKKQDNAHELKMLDKQMELEKLRATEKREEIILQTDSAVEVEWAKALNSSLSSVNLPTGNRYIDLLNSSVRPILTYWWCLVMYTISKGFLIYAAFQEKYTATQMASTVVTQFDRAVVGSMLGYWFCDRSLRKMSAK